MTSVYVLLTGQLRSLSELPQAIDRHVELFPDIQFNWVVSTWTTELDLSSSAAADLRARQVRVILSPQPPPWGSSSGLAQHLALGNGLYGVPPDADVIKSRSDVLAERGIGAFLNRLRSRPATPPDSVFMEAIVLGSPFFAADMQFMTSAIHMSEIAVLDAPRLSKVLNTHVEQHYFMPRRFTCPANDYWRLIDIGTQFNDLELNKRWAVFRTTSPLYASAIAEYFRYVEDHWVAADEGGNGSVLDAALRETTLEDLLFSKTTLPTNFNEASFLTSTTALALTHVRTLERLKPSPFGEAVLEAGRAAPSPSHLLNLTEAELQRLNSDPILTTRRRDVTEFSRTTARFSDAPEHRADTSLQARIRFLEEDVSRMRRLVAETESSAKRTPDVPEPAAEERGRE